MSSRIVEAKVVGGEEVAKRFSTVGSNLRERLKVTFSMIGEELKTAAQTDAKVRTGKLLRSIRNRPFDRAAMVGTTVKVGKFYGRFVEFGYGPADETVKAHVRHYSPRDVRGGLTKLGRLSRRRIAMGISFVKQYPRIDQSSPRPFLMPALAGMQLAIMARLQRTVDDVMKES
jgi:hypothetical protein